MIDAMSTMFINLRLNLIARERLLDAIGVAAAQRPSRMPWQQSLDLMTLRLFIDPVHRETSFDLFRVEHPNSVIAIRC